VNIENPAFCHMLPALHATISLIVVFYISRGRNKSSQWYSI